MNKKLFYLLITTVVLSLMFLSSCQVSTGLNQSITGANICSEQKHSAMNDPEFRRLVAEAEEKIAAGEWYDYRSETSRGDTTVDLSPGGPFEVLAKETVKLTASATPGALVYFWVLLKDGVPTNFSQATSTNTIAVDITKAAYGSGQFQMKCTTFSGTLSDFFSNTVSIDFLFGWAKGYIGAHYFHSIAPSNDDGYAVVGQYKSNVTDWTALIAKLDVDGNVIWAKELGGNKYDAFRKVIKTRDGHFMALGESNSLGGGNGEWLVKFNDSGDILWEKYFNHLPGRPTICETSTGNLIFVSSGLYHELCITKMDASGNIIWQKASSRDVSIIIDDVIADDNGGFVIGASNYSTDNWVIKMSADGEIIWQKTYGGPKRDWLFSIHKTEDGYILGGDTFSFGANNQDSLLIKVNKNGDVIWQKKLDLNINYEGIDSITADKNGGIIVGIGSTLINLDSNMSVLSSRTYSQLTASVVNLSDTGFIVAGSNNVLKLDDDVRCGSWGEDKTVSITDVSVTVTDTNISLTDETRSVVDVNSAKKSFTLTPYQIYPAL